MNGLQLEVKQKVAICYFCLHEVLSKIPYFSIENSVVPVKFLDEVTSKSSDIDSENCNLCYGILKILQSTVEGIMNRVGQFTEDNFFITVHVPDVVYLNFFLLGALLNWEAKSGGGDGLQPDNKALPVFSIDTKLINIKEVFRNMLCNRLNEYCDQRLTEQQKHGSQDRTEMVRPNLRFTCNTPLPCCVNVVILPPNQNLFTELIAENAVQPRSKKMKFSYIENGNDMGRNNFIHAVNCALESLEQQSRYEDKLGSLLTKNFDQVQFQISVSVPQVFIGGRYLKFSRTLSQTPWFIGGRRKGTSSIEELITEPMKLFFKCDSAMFRSSGREDIDVKMLGNGRPFAVELITPCVTKVTSDELKTIQEEINSTSKPDVKVSHLHVVKKENLDVLRNGETEKTKEYLAILFSKGEKFSPNEVEKLKIISPLEINQKTPLRVLHRRSLLDRKRRILWATPEGVELKCEQEGISHYLTLRILTEAGTYVKEWVHGDLGRTSPSVCDILGRTNVDIVQLDVANVHLTWPIEDKNS